jgi:NADH-quinone oxidoreductase subunit N
MLQILIIAGLGILAMLSEVFNFKKFMPYIVKAGLLAIIGTLIKDWSSSREWFNHMMVEDTFSKAFTLISTVVFLIWFILSDDLFIAEEYIPDYTAMLCFSGVGGYMMLSFTNLSMLFLGIEILSIPVYVLAGSDRRNLKSNESAFKYFLMGAFASGILLFGLALIYGASGSFDTTEIAQKLKDDTLSSTLIFNMGLMITTFAFLFKVSAAPFHFWTPDVYEGAPNKITSFMATLVKIFATAAMFRFFSLILLGNNIGNYGLVGISMITILLGNILGAVQSNPKRILAYSSIGHVGFILIAIIVGGVSGAKSLLYYVFAYSLATLLAFYILDKVLKKNDFHWSIGDFNGLVGRNSLLAIGMAVALLSMAGIPPLTGFFAKYFIFVEAFKNQFYWLVGVAIIGSLIGVYYYFKFIIAMFFNQPDEDINHKIELTMYEQMTIIILIVMIVLIGIKPDLILNLIA